MVQTRTAPSRSSDHRTTARRRRRHLKTAFAVAGVIGVLLLADAAWAAFTVSRALPATRDALQLGGDELRDGDLLGAAAAIHEAERQAARAASFGQHPAVIAGGWLPWIGDDVHAVETVARSAQLTASGGVALTSAARVTGWTGTGVPGLESGGRLDLEAIRAAQPHLDSAAADLAEASGLLDDLVTAELVPPLAEAVTKAGGTLQELSGTVWTARDLSRLLPSMTGGGGPRRYFLAFGNLSAPRGTGGYLGFYGVLEADQGAIALRSLIPTGEVPIVDPVPVPPDVEARYGSLGVRTTMWAANFSPDVPTSSRVVLEIASAAGLGEFDGVIWTDTVWLADVLGTTGPVDSSAWPEPLSSQNLVDVLNRQSFLTTDDVDSNQLQAQIGLDVWEAVLSRGPDAPTMAAAMSSAVRGGHFAVYASDEGDQDILVSLGADGTFALGPNPLAVVWQDAAASRAGYFAAKSARHVVTLDAQGTASVQTTVTLHNEAPDGPPSILLGLPGEGVPVGWWGVDVDVYLPSDAERVAVRTDEPSFTQVATELGYQVADAFLFANAGGMMSATTSYVRPAAAVLEDGVWTYQIDLRPQASLRPQAFEIEVRLPTGAEIIETTEGMTIEGGVVLWTGSPDATTTLEISYI